nr:tRNA lysidine(34) synthetase TilS [Desulfobulbaceae bacterium]
MYPFEKKILTNCLQKELFSAGETVVVAVSGGADSVALLHVLFRLSKKLKVRLAVAHVNHGLRPVEASEEENLVRHYARDLGLACHVTTIDVKGFAKDNGLSLEESARNLRYAYFDEVLKIESAAKICVGHQADDQAEEILLRLIRGAGRKGLSGMEVIRDGKIVRPLLAVSRAEIVAYLQANSIGWLNDSSNASVDFLRNRIRLELLPYLHEYNPNIGENLRRTAQVLKEEESVLAEISARAYGRTVLVASSSEDGLNVLSVDWKILAGEPIAIQRRVVEKVLITMRMQPSFTHIDDILRLADSNEGRLLHLPKGLRVVRYSTGLEFSYPQGITTKRGNLLEEAPQFLLRIEKPGVYAIPGIAKKITVELQETLPSLDQMKDDEADYFDHQQLPFPFFIRNREPMDAMRPLGASGTKKIGRVLSDMKIDAALRDSLPLIASENEVAGILGVRTAHQFRVRQSTAKVLRILLASS